MNSLIYWIGYILALTCLVIVFRDMEDITVKLLFKMLILSLMSWLVVIIFTCCWVTTTVFWMNLVDKFNEISNKVIIKERE